MTQNQIAYATYVELNRNNKARLAEDARHNYATEQEAYRSNVAREQENALHNRATENISILGINEDRRHNMRTEEEAERSNRAKENISWFNAREAQRANMAQEDLKRYDQTLKDREITVAENRQEVYDWFTTEQNERAKEDIQAKIDIANMNKDVQQQRNIIDYIGILYNRSNVLDTNITNQINGLLNSTSHLLGSFMRSPLSYGSYGSHDNNTTNGGKSNGQGTEYGSGSKREWLDIIWGDDSQE